MFSTLLPFVVLATPVFSVILSNGTAPALATDDQLSCTTSFDSTIPLTVITSVETLTSTQIDTSIITFTPSISLTLMPTTLTVGEFTTVTETTTISQVTDTFSSISTILDTVVITSTVVGTQTDIVTATVTGSPSTVSIAAANGFTPVASSNVAPVKRDECGPARPPQEPVTITVTVTSTLTYEKDTYYTVTKPGQLNNQEPTTLKSFTKTTSTFQYSSKNEEQSTGNRGPVPSSSFSRHYYYNTTSQYIAGSGSAPTIIKTIGTAISGNISPIQNATTSIYVPNGITTSSRVSLTPIISANSTISSGTAYSSSIPTSTIPIPEISTSYPAFIGCTSTIKIESTTTITETASSTITNLATPYITETSTSTITTTTSVMLADASTTLISTLISTISSTIAATSITTITSTQTVSEISGATPTVYAACAPNNVISSFNGQSISQNRFLNNVLAATTAASAYDCCVACQKNASGCAGSLYLPGGACYLSSSDGKCDGSVVANYFYTSAGTSANAFSVSNGPCGQQQYHAMG
ncbi:predicted protein [Sclerotinia sclerotiorum 1980 UF-70]|uniref:Apple domain-containing protein n=2 Tax=Sclerotinia sclerotiorum (strain ATCC 18683 / 1980 / Ss-1) TaxID=665079 RepID=A7ED25_SCLS1|nr:predicted protein [Sclerotinia sclerotiorum 1980 UF-70]APA11060.1 hypothetical protein sscle_07g058300 [Sclerotinia sclerotiorum 1980 UF-70]EDO00741.1 predicted protein [Sclerotinia sclerotiorum 1980 UF-70]